MANPRNNPFLPDQFEVKIDNPEKLLNGIMEISPIFWGFHSHELCQGFTTIGIDGKVWKMKASAREGSGYLVGEWWGFCDWYSVDPEDSVSVVFKRIAPKTFTVVAFRRLGDPCSPPSYHDSSDDENPMPPNNSNSSGKQARGFHRLTSRSSKQSSGSGKRKRKNVGETIESVELAGNSSSEVVQGGRVSFKAILAATGPSQTPRMFVGDPTTVAWYSRQSDDDGDSRQIFNIVLPPYVRDRPKLEFPIRASPSLQEYQSRTWPMEFARQTWFVDLLVDKWNGIYVLSTGWDELIKANDLTVPVKTLRFEVHEGHDRRIYVFLKD